MTARWNATRDASDLRSQAADDAISELYADRDDWPEEVAPSWDEL